MHLTTWTPHPLYTKIVETLEMKGSLTEIELYKLIKRENSNVGFSELNRTLMRLEIHGKICVSTETKGKRRIELIKQKRFNSPFG